MIGDILISGTAILCFVRIIPQLIKTLKRKTVDDISFMWIILTVIGAIMFQTGLFLNQMWVPFCVYFFPLVMNFFFLALMVKYGKKPKKSMM